MILYRKAQEGDTTGTKRIKPKEYYIKPIPTSNKPLEFNFNFKRSFDNPTYAAMSKVMTQRNKDLPWVKRYLDGNKKSLPAEGGKRSTHLLSTFGGDNGEEYVIPLIIESDRKLTKLSPDQAWEHATKNNTLMKFKDKRFADYYAKNGLIKH